MKFSLTLFLLSFLSFAMAQNNAPTKVTIEGNIFNTNGDSIFVSQYYGNHYVNFMQGKLDKKGNYSLHGTVPYPDYYVLRIGNQHVNIVLRNNSNLRINADGKNIYAFNTITGSDESIALNNFVFNLQALNVRKDSLVKVLQTNPEKQTEVNQYYQAEYYKFASFRQKFIAENNNSAALLPVLSSLNTETEMSIYDAVMAQLLVGFPESKSVQNTKAQYDLMKAQQEEQNFLAPGKLAQDFTQNDVNGKPISLSDFRGKVVLIDFWASWCGPCRKENPNVVKLYNKYKDAGFTVLSVSLDKDKALWLAAIDKDGLVWPNHVSDLKYWQNEAAKQYQVSSIPFTVLVDKEGKIINTNLRGEVLEQTLQSIFGF
jgi:thiol-disulfide isomerase/thioredoxin